MLVEVKGCSTGARSVTVTKNEILTGFNSIDQFLLAIVLVDDGKPTAVRYVREPFDTEPGFAVTSVNYDLRELLARSTAPGAG